MRRTLANLEKEEAAIVSAFKEGSKLGLSMRQHLNVIRKERLFEAAGCEGFEDYCKTDRLQIPYSTAIEQGAMGEVEGYIEKNGAPFFSGRALIALSRLRTEKDGKRTHNLDVRKVRRVAGEAIKQFEREQEYEDAPKHITAKAVQQAIEKCYGEKPPKPLGEQLEKRIADCRKLRISFEQFPAEVFEDANDQYSGVVKRLADEYSKLGSVLRRFIR